MIASDDVDAPPDVWHSDLDTRITNLVDRKRSNDESRQANLARIVYLLTVHYAQQQIQPRLGDLLPSLLKSVKGGTTEHEIILALKALALVVITDPSDTIYDAVSQPIKLIVTDSHHMKAKVAAIHALGVVTFYGGASEDETQNIMDLLLEIIESDGQSIEAGDDGDVVTSSLEEWGFLATQMEDMEDTSEEPMEAFVEQLEASHTSVQVAAGENIALLFEKSYTEREDDEELESHEPDSEEEDDPNMVKRYTVWRREDQLKHTLRDLAKMSSKRLSKKDKKSLHTNFADILNSVEHPTRGPRYSNAINEETGKAYGSRMTVALGAGSQMVIDKWWKLHRLQALKRVLQSGFLIHYELNELVFDSLPVMLERD